jgi:hypothetical protein
MGQDIAVGRDLSISTDWFNEACQSVYGHVFEGRVTSIGKRFSWLYEKGRIVCGHVFAWLKIVARDVAAAFRSVSGLSTMLYMAESVNCLLREAMSHFPQFGIPVKRFDKSAFDKMVWATRIFADPNYYLGNEIQSDVREGRFLAIASGVLGTIWNAVTFMLWLEEQGCRLVAWIVVKAQKSPLVMWIPFLFKESVLSGICIISYACMFAERVRSIVKGKNVLFSVVDAGSEFLEAGSAAMALLPWSMPLPCAILQCVAAGVGMASYFLDPET